MITLNGESIRNTDPYRHKFADALTEYVYSDMDLWASDASGDSESAVGWYALIGKRILRGDSQGFVWIEKFDDAVGAAQVFEAFEHYSYLWDLEAVAWDDELTFEPFSREHEDALQEAVDYIGYTYSCVEELNTPHDLHMWRVHGRPKGVLG